MKLSSFFDRKLLKFLIVGIINTAFGSGLMFLLYNCFNFSYWISSACNYLFGGILSFFLNKYFTFQNNKKSIIQVLIFFINLMICYFISYFVTKKLVFIILFSYPEKTRGNISLFIGMCLYTVLNYIGQRIIVFRKEISYE